MHRLAYSLDDLIKKIECLVIVMLTIKFDSSVEDWTLVWHLAHVFSLSIERF